MTDRIFQQYAQGYGSAPTQVLCQIDGNTVFSGSVTTLDQPWPSLPDAEFTLPPLGWTWQDAADFEGTKQISIAVTGSPLLLAQTWANFSSGNVEQYGPFYQTEIDGQWYTDPFTEEAINGVLQTGPLDAQTPGQWWWCIPAGSTFTATMHVNLPPPVYEPEPT